MNDHNFPSTTSRDDLLNGLLAAVATMLMVVGAIVPNGPTDSVDASWQASATMAVAESQSLAP